MADEWEDLIEGEVLDCTSISISYQATGLAQVSFTLYRPKENGAPYTAGGPGFELCTGGIRFKGWVTEQTLNTATDIEWYQWSVTATCIGCRVDNCGSDC